MPPIRLSFAALVDRLQAFYGPQEPSFPVDPYEFLVWWHCGYPQSDRACQKGWDRLTREVGIDPDTLLRAPPARLASALKAGGMVPELRAQRLKEVARMIQDEFGGDLRSALTGPLAKVRKTLKRFPGIADPGADRILLFAGIAPVAAVPSNCVHVPARILRGAESKNYSADYRHAQSAIAAEIAEKLDPRVRAYLLLKRHGQETCKRTNPKCDVCPVSAGCAFFAAK
jgi:endonuclease III